MCVCIYICVCVCVCVCIHIYIEREREREREMCGESLCVVGDRRNYLQHIWSSVRVSRSSFVYFGAKTTQRAVPTWTCETGRKDKWRWSSEEWDLREESQRFKPRARSWSVASKTWSRSSRGWDAKPSSQEKKTRDSEVRKGTPCSEDDDQR